MKPQWFKRKGIFFIPKSLIGWAIMIIGIIYAVYIFIDIDSRSHSASDTLRPFFILIALVFTLIAFLTSSDSTDKRD
jgi:hypothetical protein